LHHSGTADSYNRIAAPDSTTATLVLDRSTRERMRRVGTAELLPKKVVSSGSVVGVRRRMNTSQLFVNRLCYLFTVTSNYLST